MAFMKIPEDVLTEEDKTKFLDMIVKPNVKRTKLIDNFDMMAKRARNTQNRSNNEND